MTQTSIPDPDKPVSSHPHVVGRKRAEEALRRVEQQFDRLVAGVQDYAIFLLDTEGRVASWNEGAERTKGYTAREIIGRHFSSFYPADAIDRQWPQQELKLATELGRFEDEGWRLRKDGTRFWANVVITAIRGDDGELQGFLKITRDLTERRAAEEALRASEETLRRLHEGLEDRVRQRTAELIAANEALLEENERRRQLEAERTRLEEELRRRVDELAAADRHKNEFLAMLGHELRNPLAPIRNSLALLRSDPPPDARERALQVAERQVEHLRRLVDDLLDLSRIMQGKIDVRHEPVELATVVARAVETAQPQIDAGGHRLEIDLPPEPVWLDGDIVRLAQVLSNLLSNAAKHSDRAGRIEIHGRRDNGTAIVVVRDHGAGITPELLPRIFDFFVQGERTLARSLGGLGIGLTLVKRLVELHGGSVTAASEGAGRGAEFTIRLPTSAPPREAAPGEPALPAARGGKRVLVVDDNVDAAESTAELLELWGHLPRAVYDGPSALAVAAEGFDVVLLDIGLPGMDGYEVAAALRASPAGQGVLLVAMTGYGQDEDRRRARDVGFDVHLTKPLDPTRLRQIVEARGGD
jgi:PAS domain S-box-containing protein